MNQAGKGVLRRIDARLPVLRRALDLRERRRRGAILQHARGIRRPAVRAVLVPDIFPTADDVVIATRLLKAYRFAVSEVPTTERPDVWTAIARRQQRFASLLARGDAEEVAGQLCNISRHDATEGISQGSAEFKRLQRDPRYRDFVALLAKDKLVSLAEAIGALEIENPEQGTHGTSIHRDAGELVERISARLGRPVTPPEIDGGLLKLDTGHGLFGERDIQGIYTAWLLTMLLAGQERPRICEIGGGTGRVAYWSHELGLTSYTSVDLPVVNLVQGYYALKTLPDEHVVMYGEPAPTDDGPHLRIVPAHAISMSEQPTFDLVLNQDSFPEINRDTVIEYLKWIRTACTGPLVSINHESRPPARDVPRQLSVPETIGDLGGYTLAHRSPYWLRRGYALEVYRISPMA